MIYLFLLTVNQDTDWWENDLFFWNLYL